MGMSSNSASMQKIQRNNFAPSPGHLEYYIPPGGPHVRVDSACYSGYRIPPNYDSMIAKLIVKGQRPRGSDRSRQARIEGIPYWRRPLHDPFPSVYVRR